MFLGMCMRSYPSDFMKRCFPDCSQNSEQQHHACTWLALLDSAGKPCAGVQLTLLECSLFERSAFLLYRISELIKYLCLISMPGVRVKPLQQILCGVYVMTSTLLHTIVGRIHAMCYIPIAATIDTAPSLRLNLTGFKLLKQSVTDKAIKA